MEIKEVTKGLFRGRRPLSGEELYKLREEKGITKIICLQEGWSWLFGGFRAQDIWEKNHGLFTYLTFSFSNFFPPTRDDTRAVLEEIQMEIQDGGKVYLHCRLGKDRTGWISGLYLVHLGKVTPHGAWAYVGLNGMNWHYRIFWKKAFLKLAELIRPKL